MPVSGDRRVADTALNVLTGLDERRVVLRLLADRDHQITADRPRAICRVQVSLRLLIEVAPAGVDRHESR
jgi:hypothetical protein